MSIPGKYLVYFPNKNKIAISRKINSSSEKARIRGILTAIKDPQVGLIVRTEAEGNSEEDFTNEYNALAKTWRLIDKQLNYAKAPACVFEENALENYLIRDLFGEYVDRLVIDDKAFAKRIISQLEDIAPELTSKVEVYKEDSPIFDAWAIEKKIETIFHSRVYLPSGGNIRLEQTEALVAVDVNTGSFTGNSNYNETIKKTNIEAANEIARQIRLRDLSGVIVVDFIDMTDEGHKHEVLDALKAGLNRDRAKNKVYTFTELGLVEITRKRMRTSLVANYSEPCPACNGTGKILSRDAVVMRIYRWLSRAEYFIHNDKLRIIVHPNVMEFISKNKDYFVAYQHQVEFIEDPAMRLESFKVLSLPEEKDITSKYTT
jgi:ribonuclease G